MTECKQTKTQLHRRRLRCRQTYINSYGQINRPTATGIQTNIEVDEQTDRLIDTQHTDG